MSSEPIATVTVAGSSLFPQVSDGRITDSVLTEAFEGLRNYFALKETPADAQAGKAVAMFAGKRQKLYIKANRATLAAMEIADVEKAFRTEFLDVNWEIDAAQELSRRKYDPFAGPGAFVKFCDGLVAGNEALEGSKSHLDDAGMIRLVRGVVDEPLSEWIKAVSVAERNAGNTTAPILSETFKVFVSAVAVGDKLVTRKRPRSDSAPNSFPKRVALGVRTNVPTAGTPSSSSFAPAAVVTTGAAPGGALYTGGRLPRLSQELRNLLMAHSGCFTCREPYVGHTARDKICSFPDAATYVEPTLEYCLAARARRDKQLAVAATYAAQTAQATAAASAVVAATSNGSFIKVESDDEDLDDEDSAPMAVAALKGRYDRPGDSDEDEPDSLDSGSDDES